MKNDEFRKLVLDTPARANNGSPPSRTAGHAALGAKKSSFVGMTPRPGQAPSNADFARQIRERHASLQPSKPTKKFKSSAPKGSKFAAGYTDRAKARQDAEDAEDDKAARIKALEEQVKLGQLEQETFETLRDQITGGSAASTHLVKGLDRKLLERVRRGEDVLGLGGKDGEEPGADVDDELDRLEEQEVQAVKKEQAEKKGNKATAAVAGVKRTRDEIMAELKAQRKAAAEAKAAEAPIFDDRWRRVGGQARPRIEIDHKGREVLITVDEDGHVKKKIRKVPAGDSGDTKNVMDMPDVSKPVLGSDVIVPEQPKQPEREEVSDEDIFAEVGTEYNPLGDDYSDSEDDEDGPKPKEKPVQSDTVTTTTPLPQPQDDNGHPKVSRNYFQIHDSPTETSEQDRFKGIENVLKKAAKLDNTEADGEDEREGESREEREARLARRKKMLAQQDRDLEDMDMGFGSSRFEDEEEGGGEKKVRLSEWKSRAGGGDDDEESEKDAKGDGKRKRKPKKRKGDVNNAADIMRVIEGRKAGASK